MTMRVAAWKSAAWASSSSRVSSARGSVQIAARSSTSRWSSASTSPTSSSTARRTCSPSTCARSPDGRARPGSPPPVVRSRGPCPHRLRRPMRAARGATRGPRSRQTRWRRPTRPTRRSPGLRGRSAAAARWSDSGAARPCVASARRGGRERAYCDRRRAGPHRRTGERPTLRRPSGKRPGRSEPVAGDRRGLELVRDRSRLLPAAKAERPSSRLETKARRASCASAGAPSAASQADLSLSYERRSSSGSSG